MAYKKYRRRKKISIDEVVLQINGFLCLLSMVYINKIFTHQLINAYMGLATYFILSSFIIKIFFYIRKRNLYLKSGIQDVDKMSGTEFEYFLKIHYQNLGYTAETTAVTGDYGADLILRKENEKIVAQAKRYSSKVGIKAIQEIIGAKGFYKATKGIVVTNNYFTPNAKNLAYANNIELWDREKLITIMTKENLQENIKIIKQESDQKVEENICPWCGKNLVKRNGQHGSFQGCSGYPICKYTRSL